MCDKKEGSCDAKSCAENCEIKLYYFNARARAEGIRWILSYAQVPFEDIRLTKEEWIAKKGEGFSPSGQLPLLECTDKKSGKTNKIVQSLAIARGLAFMFGLGGKTPCEKSQVDQAVEMLRDIFELAGRIHFETDEARKAELVKKVKTEDGPRVFGYFEKKITENGGKFLIGESITYADILIAAFVDHMRQNKTPEEMEEKAKMCPKVFAMTQAVTETQQIKDWIAKRPASTI